MHTELDLTNTFKKCMLTHTYAPTDVCIYFPKRVLIHLCIQTLNLCPHISCTPQGLSSLETDPASLDDVLETYFNLATPLIPQLVSKLSGELALK